ncbi:hypothetical protein LXL04_007850 [Taraxacum kok-saghyz]
MTHRAGNTMLRNGDPSRHEGRTIHMWLVPQIQGMVTAFRPVTFGSAKSITARLTDQGIRHGFNDATFATVLERDDAFRGARQAQFSKRGPFEILDRISPIAYRHSLPSELSNGFCSPLDFEHIGTNHVEFGGETKPESTFEDSDVFGRTPGARPNASRH